MKGRTWRTSTVALLLVLAAASCSKTQPEFSTERITSTVKTLSADDFEGRAPATAGERKTVDYIVAQLKDIGLQPGGDASPDGSRAWTQDVPLVRSEIMGPMIFDVHLGREVAHWTQVGEVTIRATQAGANAIEAEQRTADVLGYGSARPAQLDDSRCRSKGRWPGLSMTGYSPARDSGEAITNRRGPKMRTAPGAPALDPRRRS